MIVNLARGKHVFTSNTFLVDGEWRDPSGNRPEAGDNKERHSSGGRPRADDGGRTVLVDAGNEFDVVSEIRDRVSDLDALVLTHTHPDHVGNVDDVVGEFGVDVWGFDPNVPGVDHAIEDGETVRMGDYEYRALHTPGHKDDHLCFYAADAGVLFTGDLVFANGGFGRTDLAEGDRAALIDSIDRLLEVTDEDLAEMHTGHGPSVTTRPYQDIELAAQAAKMR